MSSSYIFTIIYDKTLHDILKILSRFFKLFINSTWSVIWQSNTNKGSRWQKRGKFINVIKSFCSIVRSLHWLAVLWEGYTFITMCNHGKDYPNSLLYSDIAFIYPFHFKGLMRVLVSCTTFLYWLNSHNAKIFV